MLLYNISGRAHCSTLKQAAALLLRMRILYLEALPYISLVVNICRAGKQEELTSDNFRFYNPLAFVHFLYCSAASPLWEQH